ncbi:sn-glycerol-3-phosphate ABC transporter ATP-binding protein UgpC [Sedimentibacter sp. zth1]|uniref:ABC transporter ATP-binding protein n=1 Tax=Sedimentibacter sp. zth1 TaxID=2816908 RepID=UPI001A928F71|nr:sn-glycerol-3-phosphate ABC transporter ATP-binding protein UgpC [Sedimentibacter sp. zth1]QSX04965.1 sn-glycerol-3-phosphate ABC transporter ATP-binding protein UgpC [Sedimentibacter sp. zth1]
MSSILLSKITKTYPNGFTALKDLTLEVKDKEFLVLVGSSGCGKSTILKIIAGLEGITKGEIRIGDDVVNNVSPKERNISMVFQDYALYPHLTVYDNMAFSLKLKKLKKKEIYDKVINISKTLKIDDILDKKPATLSGGQKQRVALGRAIIRQPEVFLFDEPLSNIDAKLRMQTRIELIKLHKQLETTFIYVTHDQTEAMTMADRIVVIKDGIIQQIDTPENLYNNPNNLFTAGFIGTPQMNFIDAKLYKNNSELQLKFNIDTSLAINFPQKNTNIPKTNLDIVVGVRPEHLHIIQIPSDELKKDDIVLKNCSIEAIELLGSEKLIYLNYADTNIIVKVDASTSIVKSQKYNICFSKSDMHIFDKATERKIVL